jgi:hypothetical protein
VGPSTIQLVEIYESGTHSPASRHLILAFTIRRTLLVLFIHDKAAYLFNLPKMSEFAASLITPNLSLYRASSCTIPRFCTSFCQSHDFRLQREASSIWLSHSVSCNLPLVSRQVFLPCSSSISSLCHWLTEFAITGFQLLLRGPESNNLNPIPENLNSHWAAQQAA